MAMKGNSGVKLQSKVNIGVKHSKRSDLYGWVGVLRIVFTVAEILGSIIFPEFAPALTIAGAVAQEALDIVGFSNLSEEQRNKRTGSFILGSIVNIAPVVAVARSTWGTSKNVVKMIDKRTKDGFRYIVKGEKNFERALELTHINPEKYSRITRQTERQLFNRRRIDIRQFKKTDDFEVALQKEFKDWNVRYRTANYEGNNYVGNKDMAVLRRLSRSLHQDQFRPAGKKLGDRGILRAYNKLTPEAQRALNGLVISEKIEKTGDVYRRLTRIGGMLEPQTWTQKVNRVFAGKWGNRITQAVQLGNPNDMAREILNKPFNKLTRMMKKRVAQFSRWVMRSEEKIGIAAEEVMRKGFRSWAGKISKAAAKNFVRINEGLKRNGFVFVDQEFVMGFRVVQAGPTSSQIMVFFNPITTGAATPGSKNYNGKPELLISLANVHINAWKLSMDPGHFYLKGGSGFARIALTSGGRHAYTGTVNLMAYGAFMAFIPLSALRNVLSVGSNFKNVGKDISKGIYQAKWRDTLVNTFERLLPNKIAKLVGAVAGAPFGKVASSHAQRIALALSKGNQHTKTKTRIVNGVKIKNTRTLWGPGKHGFNWKHVGKGALPASVRAQALRGIPKGRGNSRTVSAVGAHFKGNRIAKNVRRIPGLFK